MLLQVLQAGIFKTVRLQAFVRRPIKGEGCRDRRLIGPAMVPIVVEPVAGNLVSGLSHSRVGGDPQ